MGNLLRSEILRISLAYFLIFYTTFPFLVKLLLVYVLDLFDSQLSVYGPSNYLSAEYNRYDKVGDITTYGMVLIKYLEISNDNESIKRYITFLYVWRLIGTLMYLKTNDKTMFVYFPNLFLESVVLLSVAQSINFKDDNLMVYLLSLVAIIKTGFEYYFHMNREIIKPLSSMLQ